MILEGCEVTKNKVWRYLMPVVVRLHGNDFRDRFNSLFKMGCYIGGLNSTPYMAVFVNVNAPNAKITDESFKYKKFEDFLEWFELQDFCEGHYPVESEREKKYKYHMLKVRIPEDLEHALKHFVEGEYSKMYTPTEIEEHFNFSETKRKTFSKEFLTKLDETRAILYKDPKLREEFLKKVNSKFDTKLTLDDISLTAEVDLPPTSKEDFLIEEEIDNLLQNEIQ